MRYKTVLFDLDGTLIDTKPGILKSVREEIEANPFTLTCETVEDSETLLLANAKLFNCD